MKIKRKFQVSFSVGQSLLMGLLLAGCASATIDIQSLKAGNEKTAAEAYKAAKGGSAKFFFNEFNDEYKGDKKVKKLAIAYYQIGWDPGEEWRNKSRFMSPAEASHEYQNVVNTSMMTMKSELEKLGYQVILPTELSERSPTFSKIKANGTFVNDDMPGRKFEVLTVKDSRYIHAMTNEGKLLSKIASEASVDAVVGVFFNDYGTGSGETKYNDNFVLLVNSNISFFFTICVPREKAKTAGVSLGFFGDANHCGQVIDEFDGRYLLPDLRHSDKADFQELKKWGFAGITSVYQSASRGMVEAIYEEGMK